MLESLERRCERRASWILRGLVVGSVLLGGILGSGAKAAAQTLELASEVPVFMAMYLARLAPEGSFRACLEDYVAQGFSVKKALDACAVKTDVPFERGDGLDPAGLGWQAASPIFPGSPCGIAFDPSVAQEAKPKTRPPTKYEQDVYKLYKGEQMYTDEARDDMQKALNDKAEKALKAMHATEEYQAVKDAAAAYDMAPEAEKAAAAAKLEAARQALKNTDAWKDWVAAAEEAAKGTPKHTDPRASPTDPNGLNPCSDITAFFAQCTASGWTTPECKDFQSRMQKCGDPAYTDPPRDPVASETTDTSGGGTGPVDTFGCSLPPVDAGDVALVVCLKDWQVAQPAPGQEPCAPVQAASGDPYYVRMYRYRFGEPFAPASPPPYCGDPRALTEEGACSGTLSVVEFGQKDLQAILWEAAVRLGGPVIILPMPPPPGPPGPDPK